VSEERVWAAVRVVELSVRGVVRVIETGEQAACEVGFLEEFGSPMGGESERAVRHPCLEAGDFGERAGEGGMSESAPCGGDLVAFRRSEQERVVRVIEEHVESREKLARGAA
jgi:hypothetical protein